MSSLLSTNAEKKREKLCPRSPNDGLQRLKDMQRGTLNGSNSGITSPTFEQCWTLDPTGNWRAFNEAASGTPWTLNQTRTSNSVNEITGITNTTGGSWAVPAYDAAGNMTSIPQPATMSASYNATYDAWNRLVSLASGGTTVQQNQYDARSFRTIRITPSISEIRHFYYTAGWQCIEERVGNLTTPDRQFVSGARYIDDLVLRDMGTQRFYAMQDSNWHISSIADNTGAVQERFSYATYGNPTFLTNGFAPRSVSNYGWEAIYCGYRFDSSTGLFVVRFRIYDPSLGNWCQRDPIGYLAGANLYRYVGSRPVIAKDPYGIEESDPLLPPLTEAPLYNALKINVPPPICNKFSSSKGWNRFCSRNPGIKKNKSYGISWGPTHTAPPWSQACFGVVSAYMGTPINRPQSFKDCFTTLDAALGFQKSKKCKGTNVNGDPAKPGIFVWAWKDHQMPHVGRDNFATYSVDPDTGRMNWGDYVDIGEHTRRQDSLYFDQTLNMWYGMQDRGGQFVEVPNKSLDLYLSSYGALKHGRATAPPPRGGIGPFPLSDGGRQRAIPLASSVLRCM